MRFRDLHRTPGGGDLRRPARGRPARRGARLRRLLPLRPLHQLHFGADGLPGPTDAWITLAGLARETPRIRLGTLVSPVTFRLPGPLAITVAQVDAMSGGRVELGLGAGWNDREHAAYGIPFPPTGERFDRLEEQLAIITRPVVDRRSASTSRTRARTTRSTTPPRCPKPVQQPHPPIVMGGCGPKRTPAARGALRRRVQRRLRAARRPTPEIVGRVAAACEAIGRDPASLPTEHRQHRGAAAPTRRRSSGAPRPSAATRDRPTRAIRAARRREVIDRVGEYRDHGADHRVLPGARPARPRPPPPARRRGRARVRLSDVERVDTRLVERVQRGTGRPDASRGRSTPPARRVAIPASSPTPSAQRDRGLDRRHVAHHHDVALAGLVEQLLAGAAAPACRGSASDSPPGGAKCGIGAPRRHTSRPGRRRAAGRRTRRSRARSTARRPRPGARTPPPSPCPAQRADDHPGVGRESARQRLGLPAAELGER